MNKLVNRVIDLFMYEIGRCWVLVGFCVCVVVVVLGVGVHEYP